MSSRLGHPKIRPEHLDRHALIYVRQSTPMQVRDHIASTARQYDLTRCADQFGWPKEHIQVIDQDQGHSGASAIGRDGFQYLMAEVCLGHVGAVLSLEASRLARSNSDWSSNKRDIFLPRRIIPKKGVYSKDSGRGL